MKALAPCAGAAAAVEAVAVEALEVLAAEALAAAVLEAVAEAELPLEEPGMDTVTPYKKDVSILEKKNKTN